MFIVFCFVLVIALTWVLLTASAWLSFRWNGANPDRRRGVTLVLALLALLLGLLLFKFHLRFTLNSLSMDLSWPFAVPMLLGAAALFRWFRSRGRRSSA
jgi:hypothetical protein